MLASSLVTLRQHRFEVGAALFAAVAATVLGLTMVIRLATLDPSPACLEHVSTLDDASMADSDCFLLAQAASSILGETYLEGEGTVALSIMGVLPFVIGLLGGVPLVARELESSTAQTAWWLAGSRTSWLTRQIVPIAALLGLALAAAATIASVVGEHWILWGLGGGADLIGSTGLATIPRAACAFGIGLVAGALLGRTLPAFVAGVAVIGVLSVAVGQTHDVWLTTLPAEVISSETGGLLPGTESTGWGWIGPDGNLISQAEAREIATSAGVPPADSSDEQDIPGMTWLSEHGYRGVSLGVTDASALAWAPFDALIFGSVALLGVGGAFCAVERRRLP